MKRIGHIVDRITLNDLRREACKVASSNPCRRRQAARFLRDFETAGPALLNAIKSGKWTPSPLRARDIMEHGKLRHIEVPDFVDTLVQRVLCYPRLESVFVNHTWPHSYSSIKGRGPLKAAKYVARIIRRREAKWCCYFDVRKYYSNIDREIMKSDIRRCIKDPAAIMLIDRVIDMGDQGIAIGNTISHFLANLYLTPIIECVAELPGVSHIVVYMDNVFIFGKSKRALHAARKQTVNLLAERKLAMKNDWQIFRTDLRAVKIGGFRVMKGRPWRIYRATFKHLRRTIRHFQSAYAKRRGSAIHFARSLASLKGWITNAGCRNFYNNHINNTWRDARKVIQYAAAQNV